VLFAVSTTFPIVASVVRVARVPTWIGVVDVVVAALLLAAALTLAARGRPSDDMRTATTSLGLYRMTSHLTLALLALFFAVGARIDWTVLLVGLAWRFWLLWYVLPSLVSQFQDSGTPRSAASST
jgi:hypothetical protein